MKKLLFLVLLLSNFFGYAQYTLIPDVNFEKALISEGIDTGVPDGKVLTASINVITSLKINSRGITDLTGIQDFTSLLGLTCLFNQLTKLDISKNILLQSLDCSNNKLTSIDLSSNKDLQFIDLANNLLTNIDLSKQQSLTNLYIDSNFLKILDASNNTNLLLLSCGHNQLNSLDISKNTLLRNLYCSYNLISSLDVSKNTSLEYMGCDTNKLTGIDISNNAKLRGISCINNNLVTLNLKNGNNIIFFTIDLNSNNNLTCIQVDNKSYSDANWSSKKDATASYSEYCSKIASNVAPDIQATGNQVYCPQSNIKIATEVSITDPDDTGTDAMYIQISTGYVSGQDNLKLTGIHPTVTSTWNVQTGKLKLFSPTGIQVSYTDFISAIKDIEYNNTTANPSGTRNFSISIGNANYLPSTQHYYEFIPSTAITWTDAKAAAESRNYYGLQGYLATVTSMDEVQITGEQATGSGWIGGTDEAVDDVWRWVTGPENGTVFWNGKANGTTPNFAYWNIGEPNDYLSRGEKYAHITAPGVGIKGSWNDMTVTGDNSGTVINGIVDAYQSKGYAIEYGGMPGDPIIHISASTSITIAPQITITTNPASRCGIGIVTLSATASEGTINWFDAPSGGNLLETGNSFTTPSINTTTNYFIEVGCNTIRTPITATVNVLPIITSTTPASRCGSGFVTLQATSSGGTVNWYDAPSGGNLLETGNSLTLSNVTKSATYYAEAINNGCSNGIRIPVAVTVYTPPIAVDQELILCQSSSITLDALVSNSSYLWSTGEKTQKIIVSIAGTYTVDITSPAPESCTSRKKITVLENTIPEINYIDVNETTVVVYLKNPESYFEYSIDGTNYQSSNVFFNVSSGLQTAYVRDSNSCGSTNQNFVVLIIPEFFTPNNDSFNDVWEIEGLIYYPEAEVTIFDRYGKLITKLSALNPFWDGNYNSHSLPATDYWYVLKIDKAKPEIRGHFSLKR